ncbi:cbb3-type cytochrome c oxidase subunit I [Flavobacterium sp. Fl-318]|uniref:Cbb3-type cytochrome c oxidase subunit I n=1 Tax=Flavobacterium cupriresistens TaxID=2893885 RepID=A0ABU4RC74_9FLAO|nr:MULTISPECIES: cbb3-type cytochrome c oxidase subunit I [unclassified Flavobacterium]MDX6189866.1 cbb3-type cytochrome c oxidase subunit I [Flavobacterium sp. Fl-318]UFH42692.1 cbb3-type cytochrome c oxidase subunit I [Flavobacterium sp. F-323]
MEYIQKNPYFIFLTLIVIFLAIGFLNAEETLDINIHDTYYVISYLHFAVLLSVIYTFLAILYFALIKLKFPLIKWQISTHVIVSVGGLLLIWIFSQLKREMAPGDIESYTAGMTFNDKMLLGIFITVLTMVATQLVFVINVIQALVKGRS